MVHVCMMRQILLMHVYAMHTSVILCDAYIYVPQSSTMMHMCMMHISMILDLDPETCVYVACMVRVCMMCVCVYDANVP